jgi:hypothetical protein
VSDQVLVRRTAGERRAYLQGLNAGVKLAAELGADRALEMAFTALSIEQQRQEGDDESGSVRG